MQSPLRGKTAILVFANSSKEELKQKPMAKGEALFDELILQTLATVRKTKLPYFHYSEDQQRGNSFGERFTNAIQDIFNSGYEQIVTVGSDTPLLKASHITEAAGLVNPDNSVLGPSLDGGFYLMGLHKDNFEPTSFKKLPWQTSELTSAISTLLQVSKNRISKLEILVDVDNAQDLKTIVGQGNALGKKLLRLIRSVIASKREILHFTTSFFTSYFTKTHYNKGSPVFFRS
ncbi:DUF2064 domain-containing protein [Spongiimicrobium sp. 3-5]|uniref:TIGR04282 family arsenosugar biosynthesis glycosyltransferase n=1 Tax=Spongiimicrobium sp. 3-5 TaxID=3332596 RepID=UPI0039807DE1